MNVQNVLPKFSGTAEVSKDVWRLEKAIDNEVSCCVSSRDIWYICNGNNFLPQYQDLQLEQMGTGLKIFIRLKTGNVFHILNICTHRLRLSVR